MSITTVHFGWAFCFPDTIDRDGSVFIIFIFLFFFIKLSLSTICFRRPNNYREAFVEEENRTRSVAYAFYMLSLPLLVRSKTAWEKNDLFLRPGRKESV